MYEDEYYYEARKKENAKLDAELAGTFATVIGGLIGAVLSCLLFLLRRFDVLSSGLASLLFYMLTYTREWHVAVYITVAFVIFHRINDFTTCVLSRKNYFYNLCKYGSCNNRCRLESI